MVGLPFFALSTTSPLLQRWYAGTRARGAEDPYFLSVASNLGCLAALVAYPTVIEPTLGLSEQSAWWRWGYVGYVVLAALCAIAVSRDALAERGGVTPETATPQGGGEPGCVSAGSAESGGERLPREELPALTQPGSPSSFD
jgi:hypothetical protein